MAILGNFNPAHLAGPIVDILKEMTVDTPQMIEVEIAGGGSFDGPLNDKEPFRLVQLDLVC